MTPQDMPKKSSPLAALLFGLLFMAIGMPFVLMWAGAITPDPAKLHAPLWVVGCAGLAFVFAGITFALNAAAPTQRSDGGLPDSAPLSFRILQDVTALGIVGAFALIGTWVAVAPGERSFRSSGTVMGVTQSGAGHSTIGRIVFGLGAAICWLFVLWLAQRLWRKYFPPTTSG